MNKPKLPQTPEELKQVIFDHFKPIFKGFDKDMNGTLEREELRFLLADAFLQEPTDITN